MKEPPSLKIIRWGVTVGALFELVVLVFIEATPITAIGAAVCTVGAAIIWRMWYENYR